MQKSFKEVTMNEIVAKTGLSKGAFYHYFNSKEQVFAEVIQYYLVDLSISDYSPLTQNSLKAFYEEISALYETNRKTLQKMVQKDDDSANNYYHLIFDALKMLPAFKEQHREKQKQQLRAWENVIEFARKHKEIKTKMSDKEVAKLFVNVAEGTYINLVISDKANKRKNELKELWDGLYDLLKTKG